MDFLEYTSNKHVSHRNVVDFGCSFFVNNAISVA